MDELTSIGLEPDLYHFSALLQACAEAPHWVNGYHDIITDALARLEGMPLHLASVIHICMVMNN